MPSPFIRTRTIDSRDKKNKFAKHDNSIVIAHVSKYCKAICEKLIKIIKNIMKTMYSFIISLFKFESSPRKSKELNWDKPAFSLGEKPYPGMFIFDDQYPQRERVFAEFKKLHTDIIHKFHSRDFYGCMAACRKYIHEMNSPAYMNYVRASTNEKEFIRITEMMEDAHKYSNDSLLIVRTF